MICHGCNKPLVPGLFEFRAYHFGCDPEARVEMLEARVEMLERTIKDMIEAIPGGQYCDPQEVADTLRAIADAALEYQPAQMKGRE